MYRWSHCCSPIVHISLLHDFIRNPNHNYDEKQKRILTDALKTQLKNDVNLKEQYEGNTLMHTAVKARNLEMLELLIRGGGNFRLRNNIGETVEQMFKDKYRHEVNDPQIKKILSLL